MVNLGELFGHEIIEVYLRVGMGNNMDKGFEIEDKRMIGCECEGEDPMMKHII